MPSLLTDTDRYYLDVANSLGIPDGGPLSASAFAKAAVCGERHAQKVRARLRSVGEWRWADGKAGGPRPRSPCRQLADADVIAVAESCDGRPSSIAKRLRVTTLTINRYRARLRRSGQWRWPDAPSGRRKAK